MNRDNKIPKTKRIFLKRFSLWAVTIIVALFIFCLLATQTGPFRNWLKDVITKTANDSINGKVSIGKLSGNLFNEFQIEDFVVRLQSDTLLNVSSIRARYNLWGLLGKRLRINEIVIDSALISIRQINDSTWNFMQLIQTDTKPGGHTDTIQAAFDMTIFIDDFRLQNSSMRIKANETLIPDRINDINVRFSGKYEPEHQNIELQELRLSTEEPEFNIKHLGFKASADSDAISLSDLELQTARNRVSGSAEIYYENIAGSSAKLNADSIDISEFRDFLPVPLRDLGILADIALILRDDTLNADISLEKGGESIGLSAQVYSIGSIASGARGDSIRYDADITFNDVYVADWIGDSKLSMLVNGDLSLNGSGIEPKTADIMIKGNFYESEFEEYKVSAFNVRADYRNDSLKADLNAAGKFGKISISGEIDNITGRSDYSLTSVLHDFDLGELGAGIKQRTHLNSNIAAKGSYLFSDSITGHAEVSVDSSMVEKMPVDFAFASIQFSRDYLIIDTLGVTSMAVSAGVSGELSRYESGGIDYVLTATDLSLLRNFLDIENISAEVEVSGKITGTFDSLRADSRFDISNAVYNDISISEFSGDLEGVYRDSLVTVSGGLAGKGIAAEGYLIDSVMIDIDYDGANAGCAVGLWESRGLRLNIEGMITPDSIVTVLLRRLAIEYEDMYLTGGSDSTFLEFYGDTYKVKNFELTSGSAANKDLQSINLDGVIDLAGELNLIANINNVEIAAVSSIYGVDAGGSLTARCSIGGTSESPKIEANLNVSEAHYRDYDLNELAGSIDYDSQLVDLSIYLKPSAEESLSVVGIIPVSLSLSDTGGSIPDSRELNVRVYTDSMSLEILKTAGYVIEDVEGYVVCDLDITNTLSNPYFNGGLSLRNGRVVIPRYGIEHKGIVSDISFKPGRVTIDSLTAYQNGGRLDVSGFLEYDSTSISGNIESSRLKLIADKFYVVRHRSYEVQISSDISVEGSESDINYSGTLTINRSNIYLPAIMKEAESGGSRTEIRPMLVAATAPDSSDSAQRISGVEPESAEKDTTSLEIMENLRGNLKIKIPRNTWIRNPNMKMELSGELELVKAGADFELFGQINTVRGYYDLYNKRFEVKQGSIIFQGGKEYNPGLDIAADYQFRTPAREKKTLRLIVRGTADQPIISFLLDGQEISEGDAVSYILFGRGFDELSQGQKSALAQSSGEGSLPGKVAANLLAGQISQVLGEKLNLDVIEVEAAGNLQSAVVEVGKYITSDIFISYKHSFGSASDNDLEPAIVTMEYQIMRFLFLQLTGGDAEDAGFDFIVKLQKR